MAVEKMSKSRGNAVSVDEIVHGVYSVADGYEFRDWAGRVLTDLPRWGIWHAGDYQYVTATRLGGMPVFLHEEGNPVPCTLLVRGVETQQHPELKKFWANLLHRWGANSQDG